MFVDLQIHPDSDKCPSCVEWGVTCRDAYDVVHCPSCGRPTAPNLGVNLPAGMAWSAAGAVAAGIMRERELWEELERYLTGYGDGV